ncbi:MAG: type II secretion system protein [Pseudomonadota bacterium]
MAERRAGYTLLEAMVMLAIVAIISTLVLEAVRLSAQSGVRIERASVQAVNARMDLQALRDAVAGATLEFRDTGLGFTGDERSLRGYSVAPVGLNAGQVGPGRFGLELRRNGRDLDLVYLEAQREWVVRSWPFGQARLEYRHPVSGAWSTQWPADPIMPGYTQALPSAIMLRGQADTPTLVFNLVSNAPPKARPQDLAGDPL